MRIILTEACKNMITEQNLSYPATIQSPINEQTKSRIRVIKTNRKKFDESRNSSPVNEPVHSKFVKVKQIKITLPKNVSNAYNSNYTDSILPSIPENKANYLVSKSKTLRAEAEQDDDAVKLVEIFDEKLVDKVIVDVTKDNCMRRKLFKFRDFDFRSVFPTERDEVSKIVEQLDFKIEADKNGLINYLNSKNDLNFKLVKSINKYDDNKLRRLNKICQKLTKNESKYELLKTRIEEKVEEKFVNLQNEMKQGIKKAGALLKQSEMLMKLSPDLREAKKRMMMERMNSVKRKWTNLTIKRLFAKDK